MRNWLSTTSSWHNNVTVRLLGEAARNRQDHKGKGARASPGAAKGGQRAEAGGRRGERAGGSEGNWGETQLAQRHGPGRNPASRDPPYQPRRGRRLTGGPSWAISSTSARGGSSEPLGPPIA